MKRPIKVNRHKGGRVDINFRSSVGSNILGGLVEIPSEPEFFLVFLFCNWQNCSLPARIMCFFNFTSAAPKKLIFYKYTA